MKRKLLLSFLTLLISTSLFTGCKKENDENKPVLSTEPTAEEQVLLDLCDLYIECNDFTSANTLVETTYGENTFFKQSKNRLEKKEENLAGYVDIMQKAKEILDKMVYPEGSIPLYNELYALQSTEEFATFKEYLGDGGSFTYIPHDQLASSTEQCEATAANGLAVFTGKNCDCIYWYFGSFYGTTKNRGILVHADENDAVVVTGLSYELVRVVEESDTETAYVEQDTENPEIEDTLDQPLPEEEIEFVMEERIIDSVVNEYFFKNGSYERKITGPIKNGYFDGEVTFTEFVGDIAYTGTGIAHDGIFERLTDAIPSEMLETNYNQYVCAALYDPYGELYSLKLSSTQGLAELHHYTVCPEKYQVYSTARNGQITAFPFIGYKSLYRLNVNFTTLGGDNVLFTLNGPVSVAECSSDDFSSLTLYSDSRTRYLSAKVLGPVVDAQTIEDNQGKLDIIPSEEKVINLPKETVLSWLDENTTYNEDSYYSVFECTPLVKESTFYLTRDGLESYSVKHATVGKTILKVTTKDSTGIVYEGYLVFLENYKTGIRYQFSYMVERSLFEEERDLEIAQSIMLLDN